MLVKDATGRAHCYKCTEIIKKGGKQVGEYNHGVQFESMVWFHPTCFIEVLKVRMSVVNKHMQEILALITAESK
jgi:hypothetical protein